MNITNELLAAYAEGNVSQEERKCVRQYLTENPQEWDTMLTMMDDDYELTLDDDVRMPSADTDSRLGELLSEMGSEEPSMCEFRVLPAMAKAAENRIDNLCVIRCEGIALRRFGFDITDDTLIQESQTKGLLHNDGIALHNIGYLAGSHGLGVSHRYECRIDDVREALDAHNVVIAAIDADELIGNLKVERKKDLTVGETPNHVVIVESVGDDTVTISDSATPQQHDVYPLSQFMDAWNDSSRYIVVISDGEEYEPHPIDLTNVEISDDLIELREAIAENAHEVWAYNRKKEGWTYGPERDDAKKLHPDMIAYNRLPESEKLYDREMAMNTIKLLRKLGWELKKKDVSEKKMALSRVVEDNGFTEVERRAVVTLALKLLCADNKISSEELSARNNIYKEFGINFEYERKLISYSQASKIYNSMTEDKCEAVKDILHELSLADGNFHINEQQFIKDLEKLKE